MEMQFNPITTQLDMVGGGSPAESAGGGVSPFNISTDSESVALYRSGDAVLSMSTTVPQRGDFAVVSFSGELEALKPLSSSMDYVSIPPEAFKTRGKIFSSMAPIMLPVFHRPSSDLYPGLRGYGILGWIQFLYNGQGVRVTMSSDADGVRGGFFTPAQYVPFIREGSDTEAQ